MTAPANKESRPSIQPSVPPGVPEKPEPESGTSIGIVIFLYFTGFFVIALLIAALLSSVSVRSRFVPFAETDLGTVKSISYVSSFAPSTQVSTDRKTFLLSGIANLDPDTRLIRRQDFVGQSVCIDKTHTCWELLGN